MRQWEAQRPGQGGQQQQQQQRKQTGAAATPAATAAAAASPKAVRRDEKDANGTDRPPKTLKIGKTDMEDQRSGDEGGEGRGWEEK